MCARERGLDLVICDLRRGCREEDNVSAEIFFAELARLKAESAAVCFLVLSGDKYGYRPVPVRIPKDIFEELTAPSKPNQGDSGVARQYYLLDENRLQERSSILAPEYVLKPAMNISESVERDQLLSRVLRDAAKLKWPLLELENLDRYFDLCCKFIDVLIVWCWVGFAPGSIL